MVSFDRIAVAAAAMALALGAGPARAAAPLGWHYDPSLYQTAPGEAPLDPQAIDDLVTANHILSDQGVLDAFGHITMRDPRNSQHYIMSRWVAPGIVAPDDITVFTLDSVALTHKGQHFYSERYIHGEIYKVRPDVMAIVHSHSPSVVPFGVTSKPFKPILLNAGFLGDSTPVFEIRDKFPNGSTLLCNTAARGDALAAVLGMHNVVLMRGHGDTVVAPNIKVAVWRAHYTEVNARMLAEAHTIGGPIHYLSAVEDEGENGKSLKAAERPWRIWRDQAIAARRGQ